MMQLELKTSIIHDGMEETGLQTVCFEKETGSGRQNQVVNLYPELKRERFEGFGGAITDAAGYVYTLMSKEQKKDFLHACFTKDGLNYKIVRIHMDSCDFSLEEYEADSDETDTELLNFTMDRTEKYIFPLLNDAEKEAGRKLEIMLSPWSPPSFMKTDKKRTGGGSLRPEYRKRWAEYICRYIREFKERGYLVRRISPQNEPHAKTSWDSCFYTASEEKEFIKEFLFPEMCAQGCEDIEIFAWDHNKERIYERAAELIDESTDPIIKGIAFHWYTGDHFESLRLVRERFPNKPLILSESCLEFNKFDPDRLEESTQAIIHEIIGNMNEGMTAFYDWNILLDETGGPNHVNNLCHAFYMFDRKEHRLIRQPSLAYYQLICGNILPGDRRISVSRYTEKLELTAYEKPNGEIAVILLNRSDEALPIHFRIKGMTAEIHLKEKAIACCIIKN